MAWKRHGETHKDLLTDEDLLRDRESLMEAWSEHLGEDVDYECAAIPPQEAGEGSRDLLTDAEKAELRDVIEELCRRENESLRLYEPMPGQDSFHASMAPERLILGGNRGGKTLGSCVEIARCVTGQDPYAKYDDRDGVFILVGKDEKHNGRVLYKKLLGADPFRVIYDPVMCKIRAYRPWLPWDAENESLCKPAAPLIPSRFYSKTDVSWERKRELIPGSVFLRATGWRLLLYSGRAAPPNGIDAHAASFDEEIEHPAWYTEVAARLPDHRRAVKDRRRFINNRFWWSATPQAGTQHLYDLYTRAEECEAQSEGDAAYRPSITKHEATLLTNTHITEAAKADLIEKLKSNEDEYQIRIEGRFAILGSRVYPELMPRGVHGCPTFPIPADWSRFLSVDPGRQVAAVLFCAVPPMDLDHVDVDGELVYVKGKKILYDELYVKRCSAAIFAERLASKVGDQVIQQMWIDLHAGRTTEMGSGLTVAQQYSAECRRQRVECVATGSEFTWARDDVKAGIEAVKRGLHVREDGRAGWLVFAEKLPNFLDEAKKYCYKKLGNTQVVTDEVLKKHDHLMDAWRYLAMANLRHVMPAPRKRIKTHYTIEAIKAKKARARAARGPGGIKVW